MTIAVQMYKFPTRRDGFKAIIERRNELAKRYSFGQKLDSEELDYLDWAEIVLDKEVE